MRLLDFFKMDIDRNRVYGLDILRSLAIVFVVFGHGREILPVQTYTIQKYLTFDGVSIFFVLSGFLIGRILIKVLQTEGGSFRSLLNFWIKRWFRTLPAYYFVLIALLTIVIILGNDITLWEMKKYFFFLQNFAEPHPMFFMEAWSLSIEEWFYLLSPTLLFLLAGTFKISLKTSIILMISAIILFSTGVRLFRFVNMSIDGVAPVNDFFRVQVVTRLDTLMFGVIGAFVFTFNNPLWKKYKVQCLIAGITILVAQQIVLTSVLDNELGGFYACVISFSVGGVGTLLLLPYLSELKGGKGFAYKTITFISMISYSMYLLNLSVIQGLNYHVNYRGLSGAPLIAVKYLLLWILTISSAYALFAVIERPFLNLRGKLFAH